MKKLYSYVIKIMYSLALVLFCMFNANSQNTLSLDNLAITNLDAQTSTAVTASFTVNAEKQCLLGNNFAFANTSSALQGTNYSWDFGDGSTSSSTSPSKTFTKAGNYKIHLEVRNGSDYAFVEKFVTVMPTPKVSYNTIAGTLNGSSFTFISSSTIESGSMNYFWDLGDASYSSLINPTKTYTAPGNYNVKLVVTSDFGCIDSIVKVISYGTIPVVPPVPVTLPPTPVIPPPTPVTPVVICQLPTTAFTINSENQCEKNNNFVFTNGTTVTSGTLSYVWDFGDGSMSNLMSVSKSYTSAGTYQVKLVATNNLAGGCSTTVTKNITVISPEAAFTINPISAQCLKNNKFNFTNSSHANSNGLQYQWDLGDGTLTSDVNPSRSYANTGNYNVRLIVALEGTTCKDTLVRSLTVYPSPIAGFSVDNSCYNNTMPIKFKNLTANFGDAVNYEWYFGNGNSSVSINPTEMYATSGVYNVKLIASTVHGCIDSIKQTISLQSVTAAFTINSTSLQCLKDNSFTFTNSSHATTSGLNYKWNLAEGTASNITSPLKSFTSAGTYQVQLIAKIGVNGCADTLVKSLTVYPMPVADFVTSMLTATSFSSNIQFTNKSTVSSGNNNYSWFFNDGTSSVATSLAHRFPTNPTTTMVKLVVSTNNGCVDSISKSVSLISGLSSALVNGVVNSSILNSGNSIDNVAVFPNPVISSAQVNVLTVGNQLIIVTMSDYNGRVVYQTRQTTNNTITRVTINMQSLLPGSYIVDARSATGARLGSQIITKVN